MSVYCVVSSLYNICLLHIPWDLSVHLSVHEHLVSNCPCCELLDMTYQCIANEVMKTHTAKNYAIIMAASKKFVSRLF